MEKLSVALIATFTLVFHSGAWAGDLPPEIPLWKEVAPGSAGKPQTNTVDRGTSGERRVLEVHVPSLTPYLPEKSKATGTAVLVIPGGGHRMLAIQHEGDNVAEWLRDRGIAAFVLQHRLARATNSSYKIDEHALADTQRAMRMIRSRAQEWNIDPKRVGAIGFSAGGELVSMVATKGGRDGDAKEALDREDSKPDFQALIYPGRSGDIKPTKDSPPVFLACGFNDRQDIAEGLAEVYLRFKKAGVPAELHIYAGAGHGFGLRESNRSPAGAWAIRFEEWMIDRSFLKK